MKKILLSFLVMTFTSLGASGLFAQSSGTLEVVYLAGVGTEADYLNPPNILEGCLESYLLSNNNLTTTATMTSVTGGNNPVVTVSYTVSSPADSTTIVTATTGGPFPFGFGMINCLTAGNSAIDGFGFTSQIQSATLNFGPPTAVPTLSQWGLILFGLVVLCIGGIALLRNAQPKEMPQV